MSGFLTARQVATVGEGSHKDGGNLYLRVRGVSRAWVFRWKLAGKVRELGLGPTSGRSLAEARSLASELRNALANGEDPNTRLRAVTGRDKVGIPTFAEAAGKLIEAKAPGWSNSKHAQQWSNTLRDYAFPTLGKKRPADIAISDVVSVLKDIWTKKPETASRVRQRIESVLDYCTVHGWRAGENPARLRGVLDKVLPPSTRIKTRRHFAAAGYDDLPAIMAELNSRNSASALALRFIILTASRSGEARGASWDEIDLAARLWTVPAARMKARRPHRVPLSDEAVSVLEAAKLIIDKRSNIVFPSPQAGKALSDVTVSKVLHAIRPDLTVHGFRSCFRDWAAEKTSYPPRACELALAHINTNTVEAAYQRSDLLDQRRDLMADWGRWSRNGATKAAQMNGGQDD